MKSFFVLLFFVSSVFAGIRSHREKLVEAVQNGENFQSSMKEYHQHLIEEIGSLIEAAEQDLYEQGIVCPMELEKAFYCFGSTGTGLTFPKSDLEFGVLFSRKDPEVMDYISKLVKAFHDLAEEEGLLFDKNGWVPLFHENGEVYGRDYLISPPSELSKIRSSSSNSTLSYTLYKTCFLYGAESLFEEFEYLSEHGRYCTGDLTSEEIVKTNKSIQRANILRRDLAKLLYKREGNDHYSQHPEFWMELKFRIIKPLNELIQFFCMKEGIWESNSFSGLHELQKYEIITAECQENLTEIIEFISKKYILFGDPMHTTELTDEELQLVVSYLQTMITFYSDSLEKLIRN